jgi:hypothetical protein
LIKITLRCFLFALQMGDSGLSRHISRHTKGWIRSTRIKKYRTIYMAHVHTSPNFARKKSRPAPARDRTAQPSNWQALAPTSCANAV